MGDLLFVLLVCFLVMVKHGILAESEKIWRLSLLHCIPGISQPPPPPPTSPNPPLLLPCTHTSTQSQTPARQGERVLLQAGLCSLKLLIDHQNFFTSYCRLVSNEIREKMAQKQMNEKVLNVLGEGLNSKLNTQNSSN